MIHDDMDVIAKDIRAAHTKDFDTAPDTSVADTIREEIEEAAKFKGSAKENADKKKKRDTHTEMVWNITLL